MSKEHAQSFVERFFEDDEFVKEVLVHRGFQKHEGNDEEAENQRMVAAAWEMGFKFDVEEYKAANKEYLNELGGWETMRKIFHLLKLATNLSNDNK